MNSKLKLGAVLLAALVVGIGYAIDPAVASSLLPGVFDPQTAGLTGVALFGVGNVLNVFRQDAFGVVALTDAINKIPFVPGRAGQLIPWAEQGVATTSIMLEEIDGSLALVNPSKRGGPGETIGKHRRIARTLSIPHYQTNDGVYADEVQGVREFGSEQNLRTVKSLVDGRMGEHAVNFDATLEHQRLGAVKGVILNADGSTLYNLFTEFAVTAEDEVAFDLANANPASGVLRKKCAGVVRKVADNLTGVPLMGVHAWCGDAFFDDLLAHKEVVESYKATPMAEVLRQGYIYPNGAKVWASFEFGGIVWENYRGAISGTPFVDADKCHIFPMTDRPGLWRTVYAPADYVETVNTLGLPRYAKIIPMRNDKGVEIEMQMNALSYCTRPKALLKGKRAA